MQRAKAQPRRKSPQTEAKLLIASLSVALTLGAWQALARQEANLAQKKAASLPASPAAQEAAPLPTLIPALAQGPSAGAPLISSTPQPERIFLGGAQPQSPRPAPVARTGSSR